ncbi:MAG: hypothetical protein M1319_06170 [Chloroflexi bacterium]|nr:hypothetical protein [Chloroflexota bacterium]
MESKPLGQGRESAQNERSGSDTELVIRETAAAYLAAPPQSVGGSYSGLRLLEMNTGTTDGYNFGLARQLLRIQATATADGRTRIALVRPWRYSPRRSRRYQFYLLGRRAASSPRAERAGPAAPAPHLAAVAAIKSLTMLPQERIARLLGVSRQALHAWERGRPIADANRQKVFQVLGILERAARNHKTPAEMQAWLDSPRGPDGRTPAQLLEAGEYDRARLLAVTVPSPGIKRPPEWAGKPVPERFRTGAERWDRPLPPDRDDEYFDRFGNPGESADEEDEAR